MAQDNPPTALCFHQDSQAIPLFFRLQRSGLSVPGDISVTGFDDSTFAKEAELTTVRQRPYDMAVDAAQKALALIEGHSIEEPFETFPVQLQVRNSTAKPRTAPPAVGRSVYSCEITSRNTPLQPVYLRYVWQILSFRYGDISLIYGTSPAKTATSGVRFEVSPHVSAICKRDVSGQASESAIYRRDASRRQASSSYPGVQCAFLTAFNALFFTCMYF